MDEQMNNNGYQSQPNPMPNQNKDNYAVAILVLGIVSICCCAPCGIVALALRASSINDISPEKQGMATAGFITSIIGCVLGAIVLAVCVVAFCTAASASYAAYKIFL